MPVPWRLALMLLVLVGCSGGGEGSVPATEVAAGESGPARTGAAPAPPGTTPSVETPASKEKLEGVVQAWSDALNAGDDAGAARLFARGALVVQGSFATVLGTREEAIRFNESLPCSGKILELETESRVVTALFELGDRIASRCDAPPGTRAAAQFVIEKGRIVAWRQIPLEAQTSPEDESGAGEAL